MGLNYLTCDRWALLRDTSELNWDCNCPAKNVDGLKHAESCSVTPIYAKLIFEFAYPELLNWSDLIFALGEQHLIKCAICGKMRFGKDLDVIYKAPNGSEMPDGRMWYRPQHAIKAVCPSHNRNGIARWVHARS